MTNFFVNTLGGVPLNNAVATLEETLQFRQRLAPSAGVGGQYSSGSLFNCLQLTLTGDVLGSDVGDPDNPASIRAAWDSLKSLLRPGVARPLVIDDDRYVNVEVSSEVKAEAWGGVPARHWSATLTSYDDPPWWAVGTTTEAGLVAGVNAVTSDGTGNADTLFSLPVSAVGGSVTITGADGNSFSLRPDAVGTYLLDSYTERVTLAGVDKTYVFAGDFVRLIPGAQNLTYTAAGGFAFSAWSLSWQDRWY